MYGTLFLRAALTHWRSVAALVVLGASVTGLATAAREPEFRSRLQLVAAFTKIQQAPVAALAPADSTDAADAPAIDPTSAVAVGRSLGVDERLIESRVRGYAQQAAGAAVTAEVRRVLPLPYSPGELGSRIAAWSPLNSTLIEIEVRDSEAVRAARIAEAVGSALVARAGREVLPPDDPAPVRIDLTVRRAAATPADAEPVSWAVRIAGGALGGLAAGVGLAVQRVLLHRRRASMRDWARERLAAVRAFGRLANERFWGPGWR
nr:hypothetical protein GCM10020063_077640 [Dactylosporangium thailandense]